MIKLRCFDRNVIVRSNLCVTHKHLRKRQHFPSADILIIRNPVKLMICSKFALNLTASRR
jgi:hypothetical protein